MLRILANKNDYWRISRTPAIGLFFVTPVWILYEALAYHLNNGFQGDQRTGMDLLFKNLIQDLTLPVVMSILLPAGFLVFYLGKNWQDFRKLRPQARHFALMFVESLAYAAAFGFLVSWLTGFVLTLSALQWDMSAVNQVVSHIGSGVYEEIIFRLLLITGMMFLTNRFITARIIGYSLAVLVSAGVFAWFHYIDFFGEPLVVRTFSFRFLAGVLFSILFLIRGIGITVYTHSLYNVLLFFRS